MNDTLRHDESMMKYRILIHTGTYMQACTSRQTDGQTDGRTDRHIYIYNILIYTHTIYIYTNICIRFTCRCILEVCHRRPASGWRGLQLAGGCGRLRSA